MNIITCLGLVAAALTTIAFLPQALQIIKTKNTGAISLPMYSILTLGLVLWLVYGILVKDIPIIVANSITVILATSILIMKIKYK